MTVTASYQGHDQSITVNTPRNGLFVDGKNILIGTQSYTLSLKDGWNLVAFPVYNKMLYADDIIGNASMGVDMIATYNRSTGTYTGYYSGASQWKDMQLSPDQGYFIHGSASLSIQVAGDPVPGHNEYLYKGWNLLGWTGSNIKASDLMNNTTATMISVYNSHSKTFQSYYKGASANKDFILISGEGFFLLSEKDNIQQIYIR